MSREAIDALVADACSQQRALGQVPDPGPVREHMVQTMERIDRRRAEAGPPRKPEPVQRGSQTRKPGALEAEYRKRLERRGETPLEGSWTIERRPISNKPTGVIEASQARKAAEVKMRRRLRLIRSKPDWAERMKRINPLALQGQLGPEKQKHAEHLVRELIVESERVFGPWWKDTPRRIWSSGGTHRGGDATQ